MHRHAGRVIKDIVAVCLLLLTGFAIYYQVFSADYLYLDEAYQLWHRDTNANYLMFANQGRLLTGILFREVFAITDTVSAVKYIRIFSLAGWMASSIIFYFVLKIWVKRLACDPRLPLLLSLFCLCSSSVAIYIGWASCFEVFIAFVPGLFAAHLFFLAIMRGEEERRIAVPLLLIASILGVICLLFYQNIFGIFLLPLILLMVSPAIAPRRRILLIGIGTYLFIYLFYFLIFKGYLAGLGIQASDRTELVIDPIKKIKFFFSTPLSQSWSLNLLHNTHNIFSQAFPFILLAGWLFLFGRGHLRKMGEERRNPFLPILIIFLLLFLSYLPSIIAKENFSSYRTLLALSLCVTALLFQTFLGVINRESVREVAGILLMAVLVIIGYINFNWKFVDPLRREYSAISKAPFFGEVSEQDTIVFIRPADKLFSKRFGVKSYKDEFGVPSTFRDWTPDPLTRQLISERQKLAVADSIVILQFRDRRSFEDSLGGKVGRMVLIEIDSLVK